MDGGIFGLLGVISDHRGALEYDFWSRFGRGLEVIGQGMTLSTAARVVRIIRSDPSSALAASIEQWDYAPTRTELLLADLYDVTVMANSDRKQGKPKPHPMRPFKAAGTTRRPMRAAGVTDAAVIAAMQAAGHAPPV